MCFPVQVPEGHEVTSPLTAIRMITPLTEVDFKILRMSIFISFFSHPPPPPCFTLCAKTTKVNVALIGPENFYLQCPEFHICFVTMSIVKQKELNRLWLATLPHKDQGCPDCVRPMTLRLQLV